MTALEHAEGVANRPASVVLTRIPSRFVATAAAGAAAAAAVVVLGGDVLAHSGWFAVFSAYNVVAFGAAGLLWLRARPQSRVGLLLLALALITAVGSLQGAASAAAFSLGVLADPITVLVAWYVILVFPAAKLTGPARALLAFGALGVCIGFAPWFFLSPHVAGGTPLARCTAACPSNALMVARHPEAAAHFGTAEELIATGFAAGFLVLLAARLLAATAPRRRVLAPIYAVAAFWLAAFGTYQVAAYLVVADVRVYRTIGWALTAARVALPIGFVVSLVLARVFAGRALETLLARERLQSGAAEVEQALRVALADETLTLALWRSEQRSWTDVAGAELDPQPSRPGRSSLLLGGNPAEPIGELRYDDALDVDPGLLTAVASAAQLSLEQHAITLQLGQAQRRAAAAGAVERRRLEQNLHDTVQQRLVALRVNISLLSDRFDRGSAVAGAAIKDFVGQLDSALDEMRDIARGLYPATLQSSGVVAALGEAVRRHPHASFTAGAVRRNSPDAEEAAYFSTLEALQNALKYAGSDAEISVQIWEEESTLRFEVADTGVGFDPSEIDPAGGLAGAEERLRTLNGTLSVRSAIGRGTRVVGTVPIV